MTIKLIKMNHKDLEIWKKAMDLVEQIYLITTTFPSSELYGLTKQLRRAAVSIPSNIVEDQHAKRIRSYFIL